jgi:peptidoglycan/xylan/chitin deacetylase (PgdA/CDA1 family)
LVRRIVVLAPEVPEVAFPLVRRLSGRPGLRVTSVRLWPTPSAGRPDEVSGLSRLARRLIQPELPTPARRFAAFCEREGIDTARAGGAGVPDGDVVVRYGIDPAGGVASPPTGAVLDVRAALHRADGCAEVVVRSGAPDEPASNVRRRAIPVDANDTAESLFIKLQKVARDLLIDALDGPGEPRPERPDGGEPLSLAGPDPALPRWTPGHPPDESSTAAGAKRLLAALFLGCGFVQLRNWLRRRAGRVPAVVVNFHRVADNAVDHWMTLDTPAFDRMLDFIDRHYRVVSLEELQRVLAAGTNREAIAAITFDDGYRECATAAAAALENRGMTAAFYPCTGFLDGEQDLAHDSRRGIAGLPKMDPGQLRDLAGLGFEVGSHTVSHADFRDASADGIRGELRDSKQRIEAETGAEVRGLSVPWGSPAHCRPEVFVEARRAGYAYVLSHFDGVNFPGEKGYHLRRVRPPLDDVGRLHAAMEGWRGLRGLFSRAPERVVLAGGDTEP